MTFNFKWHVYSDKDRACSAEVFRKADAKVIAKALTESTGFEHTVFKHKNHNN